MSNQLDCKSQKKWNNIKNIQYTSIVNTFINNQNNSKL